MNSILPVLLVGGYGNRLWPLSRKSYPKQFSKIIGDFSLFQQSALRLKSSKEINFKPHITITNKDFRFIVGQQLSSIGVNHGPIILEPESKNTAPAILSASLMSYQKDKDAIMLVAPSDHLIPDVNEFHKKIKIGLNEVIKGKIVVFGIKPSRPETGYGYLEIKHKEKNYVVELCNFVEKPSLNEAKQMIEKGNFLWNAGIFLFRAKDMINAYKKHSPKLLYSVNEAIKNGKNDLYFFRLDPHSWSSCENISIDYAIMEREKNLLAVIFSSKWLDLGDWEAVWQEMNPDDDGVSQSVNTLALNCSNSLLRSESEKQVLVGLGLDNIIAIAMQDAVLVADKNKVQDIKNVVKHLEKKEISQALNFSKEHKPWGWFEILNKSDLFQVKKICVNPGNAISLQSHKFRSEHWIIVKGKAKVTIENKVKLIGEGESVYVPLSTIHRLENPTKTQVILIEVQTGTYFGEDDIVRYEDMYSRTSEL